MDTPEKVEWTDRELAALRAIPLAASTADETLEHTVAALHAQGVLRRRGSSRWLVGSFAAAAAVAIFVAGFSVGQQRGTRMGHELAVAAMIPAAHADATELAFLVQRTGSAWVQALEAVAMHPAAEAELRQAREAALNITEVALRELSIIAPDTVERSRLARPLQPDASRTIWY